MFTGIAVPTRDSGISGIGSRTLIKTTFRRARLRGGRGALSNLELWGMDTTLSGDLPHGRYCNERALP